MKLFQCQFCGQPLFFENNRCENCGRALGYLPDLQTMTSLEPDGSQWIPHAAPHRRVVYCANAHDDVCNWLLDADEGEAFCLTCRHNRTIPSLGNPVNLRHWREIEAAKRRLFYSLLLLGLPLATRREDPEGLAFDFLADPEDGSKAPKVMTGHDDGLITLNLAEADDVERERRRSELGEPYRTLLGHFRHEVGHYFWDRLVRDGPRLDDFRALFGDERRDYNDALRAHYANGAPPEWRSSFVSSYASSHPWEDFAETWAHYLHVVDTLETAHAFALQVDPPLEHGRDLSASVPFDPYSGGEFDALVNAWLPLTFALNAVNRSMGLHDLYPFVLCPHVIAKMRFVHACVHPHARDARKKDLSEPSSGDDAGLHVFSKVNPERASPAAN